MNGIELIAAERQRQVVAEGYGDDHDDYHDSCELAKAGAWYALPQNWRDHIFKRCAISLWPFADPAKPTDNRVRDLVKAGALIAAEIDRLQRQRAAIDAATQPVAGNIDEEAGR